IGLRLVPGVDEPTVARPAARAQDDRSGAVAEQGGAQPRPRVAALHVEGNRVAGQVAARAVAGHEQDDAVLSGPRQLAPGGVQRRGEAGTAQVVVHEVSVAPETQLT